MVHLPRFRTEGGKRNFPFATAQEKIPKKKRGMFFSPSISKIITRKKVALKPTYLLKHLADPRKGEKKEGDRPQTRCLVIRCPKAPIKKTAGVIYIFPVIQEGRERKRKYIYGAGTR